MELRDLGFDQWFEALIPELGMEGCGIARVSAVDRGSFLVMGELGAAVAELSGKLAYGASNSEDLPCVGDWVCVQYHDQGAAALIHRVFPRKTFLRRKDPGEKMNFQIIAANVDTAFIVQSCHFDFNPRRMERYLVMAAEGNVEPVVILTKTDLIEPEELNRMVLLVRSVTKARIFPLSNVTAEGLGELRQTLLPGKTFCLLGSSGVGKTSIINYLLNGNAYKTNRVSGTGEGVHTTTRRQLIVLDQGAMLIDTPGLRELGIAGAGEGVAEGFHEIVDIAVGCRFADCSHRHEPGCAVRAAIEKGEIDESRLTSYRKLKKESEYSGMSPREKREKDKSFGRFIKKVKKELKD